MAAETGAGVGIPTGNAGKWRNPLPPVGVTVLSAGTACTRHGLPTARLHLWSKPLSGESGQRRASPAGAAGNACR